MAERVRLALDIANDEYNAPLKKQFKYSINTDLGTFLADLQRVEAIRKELLNSEVGKGLRPPDGRWPNHRIFDAGGNYGWSKLIDQDARLQLLTDEGGQIVFRLNKFLTRFVTFPQLMCNLLTGIQTVRRWPRDEERMLGHGVERILEALHNRSLDRIRVCGESNCKRWFFAITEHQRYCGTTCRIRDVAKSPSFKEKRARYMREQYRPQTKEREQRAKQLVTRVKGR